MIVFRSDHPLPFRRGRPRVPGMQIFCDDSVPLAKRGIARVPAAAWLAPSLRPKDHPLFASLAVLVSRDGSAVLNDVREALARL